MSERIKNTAHPKSPTSRRLRRQIEAAERQADWDMLTNEEKLEKLEGRGMGESAEARKYK